MSNSCILDERLGAISCHLKECNTIADVGCDHGLLSLFVLKNDICKNVVFCKHFVEFIQNCCNFA